MNEAHGHGIVKKTGRFANLRHGNSATGGVIYGRHAVGEWLRSRPSRLRLLRYLRGGPGELKSLLDAAACVRLQAIPTSAAELARLAGTSRHQGVVAECSPFPYSSFDRLLEDCPAMIVLADHLQDPHNLGAVIRSTEAVGAGALILPRDATVDVTAAAEVASAGASAVLPVCRITNVVRSLNELKRAGYWVVGLLPKGGQDLYGFPVPERTVVVLGGEAGMRRLVRETCDVHISIPMFGKVESLNASVALAVAAFELRRPRPRSA